MLQAVKVKLVSPAYIRVVAESIILQRSFICIRNKSGPSIRPRGTLHFITDFSESIPLIYTT